MRVRRLAMALTAVGALTLGLTACGGGDSGGDTSAAAGDGSVVDKIKNTKRVVVGTKWDQPALGLKSGAGEPEGFDVDVAKYVIKELAGGEDVDIEWKESASSNREAFLANGTVDIIFATYSITEERKGKVTFGGPYIVAHQDTMVRADANDITKATDLAGKRICQAAGSNSYKRITDPPPDGQLDLDAELVGAANYSECVAKLAGNNLDAVTTDDAILKGYAAQAPDDLKVVGEAFSVEPYGIGLAKDDAVLRGKINDLLQAAMDDGTWQKIYDATLGKSGSAAEPPAIERY